MTTAGAGALERAKRRIAIGDQYARAHFDDRAIEAFRRAAREAPEWHVPWQRLGRALHRLGELREATEVYARARDLRPSAEVERQLAQVAIDGRDLEAAERHLTSALEMDPRDTLARYQRGHVRLRAGGPGAAREDFEALLDIESYRGTGPMPSVHRVLEGLASAHAALGDLPKADESLARSIILRPNDPHLHLARARILASHARPDSRIEERILAALDEALRLDPDFVLARRMRAWRLARRRSENPEARARAITDLEHIAERGRSPGAAPLPRAELARTYFALGSLYDDRPESAEAALDAYFRGENLDSSRPESANNIGVIHRRRRAEGPALAWLCEAIARDPEYDRAYHNLALVLHQSEDPAAAWDAILQSFPGTAPRASEVVARVAAALVEVGRAEVYEALYTRGHRLKNVLGVLGDRLRRIATAANAQAGAVAGSAGGSALGSIKAPTTLAGVLTPPSMPRVDSGSAPVGFSTPPGGSPRIDVAATLIEASRQASQLYEDWTGYLEQMKSEALALEAVDAGELLRSVVRSTASPSRVKLELPPGAAPVLRGDRVKLMDALQNVVLNAVEAAGSCTLRMTLPVGGEAWPRPGARVRIEIIDGGPGIPDAIRRKIFTPGFTTKDKGSGFGLTIAARVVHLHQGKIAVESAEGRGTRVVIDLPTDLAAVAPGARAARPVLRSLAMEGRGAEGVAAVEEFVH